MTSQRYRYSDIRDLRLDMYNKGVLQEVKCKYQKSQMAAININTCPLKSQKDCANIFFKLWKINLILPDIFFCISIFLI